MIFVKIRCMLNGCNNSEQRYKKIILRSIKFVMWEVIKLRLMFVNKGCKMRFDEIFIEIYKIIKFKIIQLDIFLIKSVYLGIKCICIII